MRAVRVGQFAGHVNLSRLQTLEQGDDVGDVLRMDRRLGDGAGAVETQVHELELLRRNAAGQRRGPGLRLADQLLDLEQIFRVRLARLLGAQEVLHPLLDALGVLLVDVEEPVELDDEIGEAPGVVIEDGDVAAGHVGDVDLVALLDQADERAAHADDVVVGMRAEDQDGLRLRRRPGCVQIVAIISSKTRRPSALAGPCSRSNSYSSCSRKSSSESLSRALPTLQAQPDDRPANQGRRPVAPGRPPRAGARRSGRRPPAWSSRKVVSGCFCRKLAAMASVISPFDGPLHDRRLVLAEGHDDDLAGLEDGADAHGQGLVRHVLLAEEAAGGVAARHRIERDQARAAVARRAGLVEADVAGAADAQDLQVDAAGPADQLLVAGAVVLASSSAAIVPSGMWMFCGGMLTWLKNVSCIQRW